MVSLGCARSWKGPKRPDRDPPGRGRDDPPGSRRDASRSERERAHKPTGDTPLRVSFRAVSKDIVALRRAGFSSPDAWETPGSEPNVGNEEEAKDAVRDYYSQYVTIGIFSIVAAVLVLGTLQLSRLLRPNLPNHEKLTTYESGIDPIGVGWAQTSVRYYIFALLFVIFDVEAVFLFPWALVFESLGTQAFVEMVIFVGILALALLYAFKKRLLEWL